METNQSEKAMLQMVMNNIPQFIFWKDRDSVYLGCNENFARVAGFESPEDVIGKNDYDMPWAKTEADHYRSYDQLVMNSGKPEYHIIEPLSRADGTRAWLDTNKIPLRNDAGEIVGILGTFEDITARIRAEEALRESESKLTAVLENAFDLIFSIDQNYNILTINTIGQTVFHGIFDTDFEVGRNLLELLGPKLAPRWKTRYDRVLGGERFSIEERYRQEGRTHFSEISFNPIYVQDRITGASIISRDVTRRKRTEHELRAYQHRLEHLVRERTAELESANKELESFAFSVSHDLRAPLRIIDGFTRILLEDYISQLDEEGIRLGTVIRQNTRKMEQLITDLLSFSRLGRTKLQSVPLDMGPIVNMVFEENTTPERKGDIDFSVGEMPTVIGDRALLRQVWTNLIDNAVKFSSKRERARISVQGNREGDRIVFRIQDNGAGFDMQYAEKLFGVFRRLHREEEFPGTGVGLAIVQRIIRRHGGDVSAEAAVGEGATIRFWLPAQGGA